LPPRHHCRLERKSAQPWLRDPDSFANLAMAEIELARPAGYKNETLVMAKPVDREVRRLNLATLGVRPT
jgi:S-adenosylhomocysteine hydrolase